MPLKPAAFFQFVLDLCFPVTCLGCRQSKEWLCQICRHRLPRRNEQRCPVCHKRITPLGQVCPDCFGKDPIDGIFVASYYRESVLSRTLHTFKYRFVADLAMPLGTLLTEQLRFSDIPLPDIIIPVPLHPRRLRFRGFNQSELLGKVVATQLIPGFPLPVENTLLRRIRYTKPQIKTRSKEERLGNLRGAFVCSEADTGRLKDKSVWIIDDVVTTGTTLKECARVLKQAGARNVFGIVLAQ